MIRTAIIEDAPQLAEIYNHYIAETVVTFEERPVSDVDMAARVEATAAERLPWIVAEQDNKILGYAYASKWKGRCAYRYSVESTVYLDPNQVAKGLGSELYRALISALQHSGYHVVMGGISLPNSASIALHEKFGFEKVAHFKEVGHKFDQWVDVGYWQLTLPDRAHTPST